MALIKKFNSSPASLALEAAFKRSLFLANTEGWGRERFLEALRQVAPFSWKASEYPGGYMLVEGPAWWRQQTLNAGMALLEGKEILAEPWDQALENGYRLKSTWVKIHGLPLKLWHRAEFERLIEDFGGVLFEIDRATEEKTSFLEAKIRIGVTDPSDIPPTGKAIFRNDTGDWCWKPVRFVVDVPGGSKSGGLKRRRKWLRRDDPSGNGSEERDGQGSGEGAMDEDVEEERGTDEDLLEEEDRRNVRNHVNEIGTVVYQNKELIVPEERSDDDVNESEKDKVPYARRNTRNHGKDVRDEIMQGVGDNDFSVADLVSSHGDDEDADSIEMEDAPDSELQKDHTETADPRAQKITQLTVENEKIADPNEVSGGVENVNDRQLVVYQETEGNMTALQMDKTVVVGGTRQSLRQKLLHPEKPIPEKAAHRMKERNLEINPTDLFGIPGDKFAALNINFWDEDQKVTDIENLKLVEPFSLEEIKQALYDSAAEKTPGPDDAAMIQILRWIFIGFEAISDEMKGMMLYWSGQWKESFKEEIWKLWPGKDSLPLQLMAVDSTPEGRDYDMIHVVG